MIVTTSAHRHPNKITVFLICKNKFEVLTRTLLAILARTITRCITFFYKYFLCLLGGSSAPECSLSPNSLFPMHGIISLIIVCFTSSRNAVCCWCNFSCTVVSELKKLAFKFTRMGTNRIVFSPMGKQHS